MSNLAERPACIPALCYLDPKAALGWLQKAFGFEIEMIIEDGEGNPVHSELRYGSGVVMVGAEWSADHKSPASVGRKCTQTVHMQMLEDIDQHCERAPRPAPKSCRSRTRNSMATAPIAPAIPRATSGHSGRP